MRTSILKRFATGFMAVAMVAGLFFGMSLSAAPAADVIPSGVTYGGMTITGITVDGTAVTAYNGDTATGVIEIPVATTLAAGKTITVTATITPTLGSFLATVTGTEVADITGAAIVTPLTTASTNNYTVPSLTTQPKVSDLAAKKTVTFTLTTAAITAPDSVFLKIATTQTAYGATDTAFAFWGTGVVDRRVIPAANVDTTAKTIAINYTTTADASLLKFAGDTLPTITIGQAKTLTTFTGTIGTDYYSATISKNGTISLNGVTYTVTFNTQPIAPLNGATWADATLKNAMAYSVVLAVGGSTYTVDKASTTGFTFPAGTVLTFNKVTNNTGAATVTFKGAYLFAEQSFSATAAELTAGKTFTIVYKDGTTSDVTVKADASAVTASTPAITAPTVAVLISGTASTTYPMVKTSVASLTTVNINLVNDLIPATLQVKLTDAMIVGGSKTVDIKFYNQVFPIELTDGSYYYLSVNVSSLKNALLPVSKFDFIGVASLNNDFIPLTTWNTTSPTLNKTLFIDATGVLTDRVTYAGVLADGTTNKIWPSTSYYQPNPTYDSAYWFYARWTLAGTMYGASVKYTRPYVTFDVTDATTGTVCTYSAVFIIAKQEMYATAINSTLGGQAAVTVATGEYSQTWKQADAYSQFVKNVTTKTPGTIAITSYYAGTVSLADDYVVMTLRLPKGCTLTMPTTATGDISDFTVLQSFTGVAGNTTTDGLVDYIVKFKYRELYTGSNTVGTSTLKVAYPLTKADGTSASATAFKEYTVVTTWVAKAYISEKKVTMAGITIPDPIVAPSEAASSVAASSTAASSTAASSVATSTTSIPVNPNTGVPFNTLAYIVTIAASAIGGVSTMVLRRK